jgi:hypothetical protein
VNYATAAAADATLVVFSPTGKGAVADIQEKFAFTVFALDRFRRVLISGEAVTSSGRYVQMSQFARDEQNDDDQRPSNSCTLDSHALAGPEKRGRGYAHLWVQRDRHVARADRVYLSRSH